MFTLLPVRLQGGSLPCCPYKLGLTATVSVNSCYCKGTAIVFLPMGKLGCFCAGVDFFFYSFARDHQNNCIKNEEKIVKISMPNQYYTTFQYFSWFSWYLFLETTLTLSFCVYSWYWQWKLWTGVKLSSWTLYLVTEASESGQWFRTSQKSWTDLQLFPPNMCQLRCIQFKTQEIQLKFVKNNTKDFFVCFSN